MMEQKCSFPYEKEEPDQIDQEQKGQDVAVSVKSVTKGKEDGVR